MSVAAPPDTPGAGAAPPDTAPRRVAPTTLAYYFVSNPLADGDVVAYRVEDAEQVLGAGARGLPVSRAAYAAGEAPDEQQVRAAEARLRRRLRGRARVAAGWAGFWWLLGPALSLLWVNFAWAIGGLFFWFPPLAALVASHGAVAGGPLLAAVVGLLPLVWSWRRAIRHSRDARYWGRLATFAGSRRFREAPLERAADANLGAFAAAAAPTLAELRRQFPALEQRGADGMAEVAALARSLYFLAARRGLGAAADLFHAIYTRVGEAEPAVQRLDRADAGVFAERKVAAASRRARRRAAAALAPFAARTRTSTNPVAPALGLLAGGLALLATFFVTGAYWVESDQAVLVEPPGARAGRLASALRLPGAPAPDDAGAGIEVVRDPGFHWSWPQPFSGRHSIFLGQQRVLLRSIFRQTNRDSFDVVLVELRFRVADVDRWAAVDQDGNGVSLLQDQLSRVLQDVLQQARQEARQTVVQQNPALAGDPAQVAARADQLVEARLGEIVRVFVGVARGSELATVTGVQVSPEHQHRLLRGRSAAEAGVRPGE